MDLIKFNKQLSTIKFIIKECLGDGNCLFRSVAHQLTGDESQHKKYREETVKYMKLNTDNFAPFIFDTTFEEYLAEMSEDSTWGGNMELQAISMCFIINIVVHQLDQPKLQIVNHRGGGIRTIHLSYHLGEHYNSIVPLSEKKSENILKLNDVHSFKGESLGDEISKKEKIIMQALPGCKNLEIIRQALRDNSGDVDATIDYLFCIRSTFKGKKEEQKDDSELVGSLVEKVISATGYMDIDDITALVKTYNYDINQVVNVVLNKMNEDSSGSSYVEKEKKVKKKSKLSKKEKREKKKKEKSKKSSIKSKKQREKFLKHHDHSPKKKIQSNEDNPTKEKDSDELSESEIQAILEKTKAINI